MPRMMCHTIGLPPTGTIGLGRSPAALPRRVPNPPQRSRTFISSWSPSGAHRRADRANDRIGDPRLVQPAAVSEMLKARQRSIQLLPPGVKRLVRAHSIADVEARGHRAACLLAHRSQRTSLPVEALDGGGK